MSAADITGHIEELESYGSRGLGPRVVAKAWTDPAFKKRLLEDGVAGVTELGISAEGWLPKGGVTGQSLPSAVAFPPFAVALSPFCCCPFPLLFTRYLNLMGAAPCCLCLCLLAVGFPPFAVALSPFVRQVFESDGGTPPVVFVHACLCMLLYSLRLSLPSCMLRCL